MALLTNINGKFSVSDAGAVTFNNAFTFPTADGTANYVLKTNGSGQLAWAADSYENYDYWVLQGDSAANVNINSTNTLKFVGGTYMDTSATWAGGTNPRKLTINHETTSRTDTTSTDAPAFGGTFEAVTSVTTNTTGHVTAIDVSTVTIPTDPGGTVKGTGTATRVAFWSASDTITSDADLYWDNTNKRLGIGTTGPVNKLGIQVAGNSNTKAINIYNLNTSPNSYTSIGSQYSISNTYVESEIRFGNETQSGGASYLGFVTGGSNLGNTEKMRITSAGNVGIGTTEPESGAKLDVRAGSGGKIVLGSYNANYKAVFEGGDQLNFYNGTSAATAYINYGITGTPGSVLLSRNLFVEANSSGGASGTVRIKSNGNVGIGTTGPFSKLQVGNATFTGGNGMYADSRVGISNHGALTGLMLASTYNDATHPEYGLVFVQGPDTSSYNVWSISPDGPARGSGLSFNYQAQATNIHPPANTKVYFEGSTGNVGIGTTSPRAVGSGYKGLEVSSPSSGSSLWLSGFSDTTKGYLAMDTGGLNLTAISNHSLTFGTNNSPRMTILSGGNVGINDTSPGHTLSVGGPAKMSAGLLVGSMTLITNFTAPYFTHNTANLNVDLNLGNTSFWGHLEVTITGTYSNQNTPGKLTKIYAVGYSPGGTIYTNVSRVSDAMGPVVTQINLGEVRWDSTTSTYRIRIAHIVSTGNQYWIQVKGFSSSGLAQSTLPDLGISSVYTQSTTGLGSQAVYYNNNVGIGISQGIDANLRVDANSATLTQEILKVKGGGSGGNFGFLVEANNGDDLFKVDTLSYNSFFPNGNVGIATTTFAPTTNRQLKMGNMGSGAVGEIFDAVDNVDNSRIIICGGGTGTPQFSMRHYSASYGLDIWMNTGSPWDTYFDVRQQTSGFRWRNYTSNNGGEVDLMTLSGVAASIGTLTVKGDVVAYGSPSDKRLKENIKPIESALDKVSKLQGVTFDWKKSDSILEIKEDIGFIAQDVQKVIPELVRESEGGMLSMRHQGIAPILLEAIKELKAEIEELKLNKCNCNCNK
jgi:hypothetical protein